MTGDALTVYFTTLRGGPVSSLDFDNAEVYRATRTTKNDAFSSVAAVTELNTRLGDYVDWVSLDDCRLYVTTLHDEQPWRPRARVRRVKAHKMMNATTVLPGTVSRHVRRA